MRICDRHIIRHQTECLDLQCLSILLLNHQCLQCKWLIMVILNLWLTHTKRRSKFVIGKSDSCFNLSRTCMLRFKRQRCLNQRMTIFEDSLRNKMNETKDLCKKSRKTSQKCYEKLLKLEQKKKTCISKKLKSIRLTILD